MTLYPGTLYPRLTVSEMRYFVADREQLHDDDVLVSQVIRATLQS